MSQAAEYVFGPIDTVNEQADLYMSTPRSFDPWYPTAMGVEAWAAEIGILAEEVSNYVMDVDIAEEAAITDFLARDMSELFEDNEDMLSEDDEDMLSEDDEDMFSDVDEDMFRDVDEDIFSDVDQDMLSEDDEDMSDEDESS